MISVIKGFEIDKKSDHFVTAAAGRCFVMMVHQQEEARVGDGGCSAVYFQPRVSSWVDLAAEKPDLVARVSGKGEQMSSKTLDEVKMRKAADGEEDDGAHEHDITNSLTESSGWLHGFKAGDMVWGKVKSHPWWPGHIYNESFASNAVRKMKREGLVLVAFFGDSSYGWFDPAELIPFELHFLEKSRQTSSRSFVRAVEEALDEVSRRSSLALACRCRNMNNFRPSTVSGYFAVDIVGYEPGGTYSSRQIKKSRDDLVPVALLSFMHQLAEAPYRNEDNNIQWIQKIAKLLAYRRAIFEEFDETYAQAFGVEPLRPAPNSVGTFDQTDRFTSRVAPLTGPLVVAENLSERRSSARHASIIAKKNKFVLKRREDLLEAASIFLPDPISASQPLADHGFIPSLSNSTDPVAYVEESSSVPRKKEIPAIDTDEVLLSLPAVYSQKSEPIDKMESGSNELLARSAVVEISQVCVGYEDEKPPFLAREGVSVKKEKKGSKRFREDLGGEVKKKKKTEGIGADQSPSSLDSDLRRVVDRRSIGLGVRNHEFLSKEDGVDMEASFRVGLGSLQLPQLLDDLSSVALDPFYGIERDAPSIVRHVFLQFRSQVYQKSLVLPVSCEIAATSQPSAADLTGFSGGVQEARERRESSSSFKAPKLASRVGENPTKVARKREPSDRQEELSVKKMKKMNQLKELATKKKAVIAHKSSEFQPKDKKGIAPAASTEATRKQEQPPPPPKLPSPTFLIMKFPPRSTLPSVSNLKARFARFGPLDLLGTSVQWKTHTCRVLFKHKSDAQSACNFVQSNDLFGQIKVLYHLRDLEVPAPEQPPLNHPKKPSELTSSSSSQPDKDPFKHRLGSSNPQIPSSLTHQSQSQLKSILKKPAGDEPSITRESPRVTFMLNADDDQGEHAPSKTSASSNNGSEQPADQIPSRSTSLSSPAPAMPQPPPYFSISSDTHPHPYHLPPLPAAPVLQTQPPLPPLPPRAPQLRGPDLHSSRGLRHPLAPPKDPRAAAMADISAPMLRLLLKCNDIVSNMRSSMGYIPYHSL